MNRDTPLAVVATSRVTKKYRSPAGVSIPISDVTFAAVPKELTVLLGPSGSGKSTFLLLLAGVLEPTEGEVMLFGRRVVDYTPSELQQTRASRIGIVFQNFLLLDWLSGLHNVQLVTAFSGTTGGSVERSRAMLRELGIEHLADKVPAAMSQGEKQRIALARAFVNEPDVVLADEPTAALELSEGLKVIDLLHRYATTREKCVIVASHDMRICDRADRVVRIENGKLL